MSYFNPLFLRSLILSFWLLLNLFITYFSFCLLLFHFFTSEIFIWISLYKVELKVTILAFVFICPEWISPIPLFFVCFSVWAVCLVSFFACFPFFTNTILSKYCLTALLWVSWEEWVLDYTSVLLSLGCYNKALPTGWFVNNRNLLLTI